MMEPYWSEANGHVPHSVKYESETAVAGFPYCADSSLNFSTSTTAYSEDDGEYATGRRNKTSRQDPLSHRIIEKRRRDRMNSCLADLSRLIPPQYQRKGRGRIEKTEIIEMAIRHLKHLQSECMHKDNDYRLGYTDCMKEAAKFLCDSQMQDFCYRLIARLQEHCDELMKNDCIKTRNSCHAMDSVSASSGSPLHHPLYHSMAPLYQLRDILGGTTSDVEHSNDPNDDVKDLSFRKHLHQLQRNNMNVATAVTPPCKGAVAAAATTTTTTGTSTDSIQSRSGSSASSTGLASTQKTPHEQQAAVVTSTGASTTLALSTNHLHLDASNHDFDSSHEPLLHTDTMTMHSPPSRETMAVSHHLHPHQHSHSGTEGPGSVLLLQSNRMRNFSESSHDIEHNNNYKYKNHIKERFNHELHDEETSSEHCLVATTLQSEHSQHAHSLSEEHSKDGTEPDVAPIIAKKRKLLEAAAASAATSSSSMAGDTMLDDGDAQLIPVMARCDDKKPPTFCFRGDIKTELNASGVGGGGGTMRGAQQSAARPYTVPIFALHGHGTFYVPLNVDYSVLVPFLNGVQLLDKGYTTTMPAVHPISINVNFMATPTPPPPPLPPSPATAVLLSTGMNGRSTASGQQSPPPSPVDSGNLSGTPPSPPPPPPPPLTVAVARPEAIVNGW